VTSPGTSASSGSGAWARALALADATPDTRNRYVDLLRAIAISAVVIGHWTMAAPYIGADGRAAIEHLLVVSPPTRMLTWLFQVMPVFFFVGGFSNGTSWRSALGKGQSYADWFSSRLQRLLAPTLVLLGFWAFAGFVALRFDVPAEMVYTGSQIALIPTWFLAVYVLVCMGVPWTLAAWERFGLASVVVPLVLAGVMDVLFFTVPAARPATWINYLFIWLAVHQLGYAWRDGLKGGGRSLIWGLAGLGALGAMVTLGPYPISLVGVPGQTLPGTEEILSNTRPPKLPLASLAIAQIGLLLSLQGPANRLLSRRKPWAATVLANGMIMTVFLWHSTAMMLLFGLAIQLGGIGLEPFPGSGAWWAVRPVWILLFALVMPLFVAVFRRFERTTGRASPPAWRLIIGCFGGCVGLAFAAIGGVNDPVTGQMNWVAIAAPFIGCWFAGFGPLATLTHRISGRPA